MPHNFFVARQHGCLLWFLFLQDRGVDFPVRPQGDAVDAGVPYYTPPEMPPAAVAAAQGLSPEDRAAIAGGHGSTHSQGEYGPGVLDAIAEVRSPHSRSRRPPLNTCCLPQCMNP